MKLEISPFAQRQIEAIVFFIAEDSPAAAERWYSELRRALVRIESLPNAGRGVKELAPLPLREARYGSYRIIYEVESDTVNIHGVVHGARNLRPRLIGLDDEE